MSDIKLTREESAILMTINTAVVAATKKAQEPFKFYVEELGRKYDVPVVGTSFEMDEGTGVAVMKIPDPPSEQ